MDVKTKSFVIVLGIQNIRNIAVNKVFLCEVSDQLTTTDIIYFVIKETNRVGLGRVIDSPWISENSYGVETYIAEIEIVDVLILEKQTNTMIHDWNLTSSSSAMSELPNEIDSQFWSLVQNTISS